MFNNSISEWKIVAEGYLLFMEEFQLMHAEGKTDL